MWHSLFDTLSFRIITLAFILEQKLTIANFVALTLWGRLDMNR